MASLLFGVDQTEMRHVCCGTALGCSTYVHMITLQVVRDVTMMMWGAWSLRTLFFCTFHAQLHDGWLMTGAHATKA